MKYEKIWQKTLGQNEEVKYEFSVAQQYRRFGLIVFGVIGVMLFFLSFMFAFYYYLIIYLYFEQYLKNANAYAFTNKRVLIHRGWLSTKTISVDYDKITDVTIVEPLLDKLFSKSGSLAINTAGSLGQEIVLHHIESPYEVKKKLDQLR